MTHQERYIYAEYIAEVARLALTESGHKKFPANTILCVPVYSPLATLDNIIGWPIWVLDMPCTYDMSIAIPSTDEAYYKLVTAFRRALEVVDFPTESINLQQENHPC